MQCISLDLETYSDIDLQKCGVYRYAASPNFEILLFGYSVDGGEVQVVDLAMGEKIPEDIVAALKDDSVIKWAYNATFERIALSIYFMEWLEPTSWHCTMVWSATLGLPLSLEGVGAVLGLEKQKLKEGKSLIKYFCCPCLPTKANGERTRNLPEHNMDKWQQFKDYNLRDVETEIAIQTKLAKFPVPESIWEEYRLDQEINDRGIGIDSEFVDNAIKLDEKVKAELNSKMQALTNLENPNSVKQVVGWLATNGLETDNLSKKQVAELLKTAHGELSEVLRLRQKLSKSSVKKYTAMKNALCADNRVHGMFQFYGANRTGRFSGRLVQLQNLPQNHMADLKQARALVKEGNFDALSLLYEDVPDTLSQLIRTAFVPQDDRKFIVADFSAIEARVIAWLAGENWRQTVFAEGGDIYCMSASKMFKVPVKKHGINGQLRQKGKIAELACGYGGSIGALKAMGAVEMGLKEEELKPLVNAWRFANSNIVSLWWAVDKAAKDAIKMRIATKTHGIHFEYQSGFLFITLPSGRKLAYVKPRIGESRFGGESITYEGIGVTKKWERLESYGPKLCENITQAIARDLLVFAMLTLKNCAIVAHVHDEIVIEADKRMSLTTICEQMRRTPPWAKGLLLMADGYECDFYKKD
ncbi:DNA polymerase [Phascolarctobacterium faecium]|jgi:DNA polymerase|uniref:DNA polymerase n=1 Tax=Phascolarctobacterium faecium TaxID=33025 RepID=UPI00266FF6B6|nr:DNA polymerase [Phascolarctobacterium faecium]MBS5369959.1 DNA polymerase [Coprobacillus cateniformis]